MRKAKKEFDSCTKKKSCLLTEERTVSAHLKQSGKVRSLVFSVPKSDVQMVSPAGHSQLIESVKGGGVNTMAINEADQVFSIMLPETQRIALFYLLLKRHLGHFVSSTQMSLAIAFHFGIFVSVSIMPFKTRAYCGHNFNGIAILVYSQCGNLKTILHISIDTFQVFKHL